MSIKETTQQVKTTRQVNYISSGARDLLGYIAIAPVVVVYYEINGTKPQPKKL